MGVMSPPPFKAVQPIKKHQSELQGNCRDYKDTFKESAGTTRTLSRRVQGLQERSLSLREQGETTGPEDNGVSEKNEQDEPLTGVEAAFGVRSACAGLLAAAPPGPGQHAAHTARQRKQESAK